MPPHRKRKIEPWTDQKVQTLLDLYQCKSYKELARIMGFPAPRIERKCKRLGLKKPRPGWPPEHKQYLQKHWLVKSADEIAAELGRPKGAVFTMACRMGLRRALEDHARIGLSKDAISDRFVIKVLARDSPSIKDELLKYPELIQVARLQIQLKRLLKHEGRPY